VSSHKDMAAAHIRKARTMMVKNSGIIAAS
jgi:hypothetical protein